VGLRWKFPCFPTALPSARDSSGFGGRLEAARHTASDKEAFSIFVAREILSRHFCKTNLCERLTKSGSGTSTPTDTPVDEILEAADVGKTQIAGASGIARLQGINDLILKAEGEGEKRLLGANAF
jgi:hypothetical protein